MPRKQPLRAVSEDERVAEPLSLLDAVAKGDVLEMLRAQRRLIAEALLTAAENTRPQFNNELNKLHTLIRDEESRLAAVAEQDAASAINVADEAFDPAAV